MRMTVWDPYTLARRMRDFDGSWDMLEWDDTQLDMYEEENKVVVNIKAPGFDEKNIDITIENNSLTVTGNVETKEEEEDKKKKYYRKEISRKSFTRTVSLPSRVMADKANAQFRNGILEIILPKAEESKPKKVNIQLGK